MLLGSILGNTWVSPKASMTSTGSTSKGLSQYSANIVQTVLSTTLALWRSTAVHSMNTAAAGSTSVRLVRLIVTAGGPKSGPGAPFFVSRLMAECEPLMMGGRERTTPFASRMTG